MVHTEMAIPFPFIAPFVVCIQLDRITLRVSVRVQLYHDALRTLAILIVRIVPGLYDADVNLLAFFIINVKGIAISVCSVEISIKMEA